MTRISGGELARRRSDAGGRFVTGAAFVALGGWFAAGAGQGLGLVWVAVGFLNLLEGWWNLRSIPVARRLGALPRGLERSTLTWILAGVAVVATITVVEASGSWRRLALGVVVAVLVTMAVWSSPLCDRWTMRVPPAGPSHDGGPMVGS